MSDLAVPPPLTPVARRGCDGCTMCCKLLPVRELAKPAGTWCQHCEPGTGCRIYPERPQACRDFFCGWMLNGEVAAHWRPRESRMVLNFQATLKRTVVHVDPSRPDAWRKPPYHAELQVVATRMAEAGGYVLIACGVNHTIMLARQEFKLERMVPSDKIVISRRPGPAGPVYSIKLVPDEADMQAAADSAAQL